jgi:hypothetical protein
LFEAEAKRETSRGTKNEEKKEILLFLLSLKSTKNTV